jgi:hypothetical protein
MQKMAQIKLSNFAENGTNYAATWKNLTRIEPIKFNPKLEYIVSKVELYYFPNYIVSIHITC